MKKKTKIESIQENIKKNPENYIDLDDMLFSILKIKDFKITKIGNKSIKELKDKK